jgi:PTH1 family peptidyl-tRNA hydrolase
MVVEHLAERWDLGRPKEKHRALINEGRTGPGGPRVILARPMTFMNESGKAVGPLAGSRKVPLERIVAVHDEIDLGFADIRTRLGGGLAGHNGLKSLKANLGGPDFWRVRIGVDRPDTTDPDRVAAWVLGKFSEKPDQVEGLVFDAANATERLIDEIENPEEETA